MLTKLGTTNYSTPSLRIPIPTLEPKAQQTSHHLLYSNKLEVSLTVSGKATLMALIKHLMMVLEPASISTILLPSSRHPLFALPTREVLGIRMETPQLQGTLRLRSWLKQFQRDLERLPLKKENEIDTQLLKLPLSRCQ